MGQACITNWGSFVLLKIRANVVTNWGSFTITNWDKCFYKLEQLLQIRATITNCSKIYYKLGQVQQIGEIIANSGIARGIDRPLLILYISVAKTRRFHSWIKTKPSFSNHSLNNDCLSLHIVLRYLS